MVRSQIHRLCSATQALPVKRLAQCFELPDSEMHVEAPLSGPPVSNVRGLPIGIRESPLADVFLMSPLVCNVPPANIFNVALPAPILQTIGTARRPCEGFRQEVTLAPAALLQSGFRVQTWHRYSSG